MEGAGVLRNLHAVVEKLMSADPVSESCCLDLRSYYYWLRGTTCIRFLVRFYQVLKPQRKDGLGNCWVYRKELA